jgi:uracil phosphoribosyltransferase
MGKGIVIIKDKFSKYHISEIRNKKSKRKILSSSLYNLGLILGKEILERFHLEENRVITPMEASFDGLKLNNDLSAIISTKSDFENFSKGCRCIISNKIDGYMDFGDSRGNDIYSAPVRSMYLPALKLNKSVKNLIILKSVIATGCTAITLTRRAIEKYKPNRLIIGAIFYSEQGLAEVLAEFPNSNIIVFDAADKLNSNGMLTPGIGDLEKRIKNKKNKNVTRNK